MYVVYGTRYSTEVRQVWKRRPTGIHAIWGFPVEVLNDVSCELQCRMQEKLRDVQWFYWDLPK